MTAVLIEGEVPLFDVLVAGHTVTVDDQLESYVVGKDTKAARWFTFTCSCGYTSAGRNRWSRHDLAVQMGQSHARRASGVDRG